MFIKRLLNSTKLYALANLFFAAANAISSILIVKFFGLRVYGYITYFNSFDTIIDYFGGHARSTFEYVSANSKNHLNVINSFAVLQLLIGFISIIVFCVLTFLQQDPIAIKVCQMFIFLSPGKSYLGFFRILSKVSGSLKWYSSIVILLSLLNIISVFVSNLYFDYYTYLILRSIFLGLSIFFLFFINSLSVNNIYEKLIYTIKELKTKSKDLLIYSFITLFSLVFDKLLIKHFFGVEVLGVFSLAFLAYTMFFIFGGSIIGGHFKQLTNCISDTYFKVINNSILWIILLIIFVELIILIFINYPIFNVYRVSLPYMIWLIPASILSIFVQISYIFLISKKYLHLFNKSFFYVSFTYLIMALSLSILNDDCIWFAILFLIHQAMIIVLIAIKFDFLANIFKKSITHSKIILLGFIIFQITFNFLSQ